MGSIFNMTIKIFIPIIIFFVTIITAYLQIYSNNPTIEIKTISSTELTSLPDINGLSASYIYKKQPIESLWKLHYVLSNIGDKNIIGKGNKKHIIGEYVKFSFPNNFKILDLDFIDNHNFALFEHNESEIFLSFLQWKQGESIELIMYLEQLNSAKKPILKTNDRNIIDGEVKYSSLTDEITHNQETLFYKMPKLLQSFIKFLTISFSSLLLLIVPFALIDEYRKSTINVGTVFAVISVAITAIVSLLLLIS